MTSTDAQVKRMRSELGQHGQIGRAALRAAMDRKTARRYRDLGKLPSEAKEPRTWRTREDPFALDWPEIEARLREAPELEGVALFEDLMRRHPGRYQPGQVRTLQRRIKRWRAQEGPDKRVFFAQVHRPGEAMQTDFTWATVLGVTVRGVPLSHLLCHSVFPYSNWDWATVCYSESTEALKRGVQATLLEAGGRPEFHQTDHSTAATHQLSPEERTFNQEYLELMAHFSMTPRTIGVGEKEQNGDIEAANGALKRRLEQHLLLRGSRDFESVVAYESWLQGVMRQANALRQEKFDEERAALSPLPARRFPEFTEVKVRVRSGSTIRVKRNVYSLPSRLIGEEVSVRLFDDHLEVYYASRREFVMERLRGEGKHRIDYRHVIESLLRHPGAFERYRYREDLFPSLVFRQAYDRLREAISDRRADVEYLRLLKLAKDHMESEVEAAVEVLMEEDEVPTGDRVKGLVQVEEPAIPVVATPEVDLQTYDELLDASLEAVA